MTSFNELIKNIALLCVVNTAVIEVACRAADNVSGKATVYANSFEGKKTATGDTYNKNAPTAASNKLPLGSKVQIKDKQTGKSAIVKINDREGKNTKAVVDLSKSAANKLGVKGTAPVQAKVVGKATH